MFDGPNIAVHTFASSLLFSAQASKFDQIGDKYLHTYTSQAKHYIDTFEFFRWLVDVRPTCGSGTQMIPFFMQLTLGYPLEEGCVFIELYGITIFICIIHRFNAMCLYIDPVLDRFCLKEQIVFRCYSFMMKTPPPADSFGI